MFTSWAGVTAQWWRIGPARARPWVPSPHCQKPTRCQPGGPVSGWTHPSPTLAQSCACSAEGDVVLPQFPRRRPVSRVSSSLQSWVLVCCPCLRTCFSHFFTFLEDSSPPRLLELRWGMENYLVCLRPLNKPLLLRSPLGSLSRGASDSQRPSATCSESQSLLFGTSQGGKACFSCSPTTRKGQCPQKAPFSLVRGNLKILFSLLT